MRLQELFLFQFKNFKECLLDHFSPKVNAIIGPNGSGKTNLLDAIYLLCFTKSAFNNIDAQLVHHGQKYFMATATFEKYEKYVVNVGYTEGQKKVLKVNQKAYTKLSEHIGHFPAVLISPYDQQIIHLGSEVRRKFFDAMIAQYDTEYLKHLLKYNRALKHRNNLLQQFFEHQKVDKLLIEPFNMQLLESAVYIQHKRDLFLQDFGVHFKGWMSKITQDDVTIAINYMTTVNERDFSRHLQYQLKTDIIAKRTTQGIHKDDFQLLLNNEYPLKKFGSQGQQKSCIMAMKLAQYDLLKEKKEMFPILLLDDILDKLDDLKINALTQLISSGDTGQVFVTDANVGRIKARFESITDIQYYHVLDGTVKREE